MKKGLKSVEVLVTANPELTILKRGLNLITVEVLVTAAPS